MVYKAPVIWLAEIWGLELTFSFPFAYSMAQSGPRPHALCALALMERWDAPTDRAPRYHVDHRSWNSLLKEAAAPSVWEQGVSMSQWAGTLSAFEVIDDTSTLVFLVQHASKIQNSLLVLAKVVWPATRWWVMPQRVPLAQVFRLHSKCRILLVSYLASCILLYFLHPRDKGAWKQSFDWTPWGPCPFFSLDRQKDQTYSPCSVVTLILTAGLGCNLFL